MRPRVFDLRAPSLIRGNVLVAISLLTAVLVSHAPEIRPTLWLTLPLLLSMLGAAETTRCMQKRWSWYHGGVLLLLYSDLMVAVLIAFFLIYPFFMPPSPR